MNHRLNITLVMNRVGADELSSRLIAQLPLTCARIPLASQVQLQMPMPQRPTHSLYKVTNTTRFILLMMNESDSIDTQASPLGLPTLDFDDPLFANVKRRKTPPLTQEEQGEFAEASQRLRNDLERSYLDQQSKLVELGLAIADQNTRWEYQDSTKLISTVHRNDASLQPKPELWEHTNKIDCAGALESMGSWPARLLHVPTCGSMTSLKWRPGNWYGDTKEPPYVILSYTWGRWRLPSKNVPPHPALNVSSVTWDIPPVDESLFSVTDFESVIRTMTREADTDFAWVDIACIDQNPGSAEGAREIGRQASIFDTANKAFIWLLRVEESPEDPTVEGLLQQIEAGSSSADAAHRHLFFQHALPKSRDEANDRTAFQHFIEREDDNWINSTGYAITKLTQMPWFSSLWTLQEAFLRPTAKFIDRRGDISCTQTGRPYELNDLLSYCQQFHQLMSLVPKTLASGNDRRDAWMNEQAFKRVIQRTGLHALADRDRATMYSCASLRQTSRPEDRIYGIMQIWNFQLGKASPGADPAQTWTTEQLELDLGKALIEEFPVESQLQVHMESVADRQSWRISRRSEIPLHTLYLNESGHLNGRVHRHGSHLGHRHIGGTTYAYFKGKVCAFESLLKAWSFISEYDSFGEQRKHQSAPVRISLDENVVLSTTVLQTRHSLQNVPEQSQLEVAEKIVALFQRLDRPILVLLLGAVTQDGYEIERTTAVGLIVMDAPDPETGGWKKRLGICLWDVIDEDTSHVGQYRTAASTLSGHSLDWHETECLFG